MDEPADASMSAGFWGQLKSYKNSVKIKVAPNTTGTFGGKIVKY
jgi:hypothetical protein